MIGPLAAELLMPLIVGLGFTVFVTETECPGDYGYDTNRKQYRVHPNTTCMAWL